MVLAGLSRTHVFLRGRFLCEPQSRALCERPPSSFTTSLLLSPGAPGTPVPLERLAPVTSPRPAPASAPLAACGLGNAFLTLLVRLPAGVFLPLPIETPWKTHQQSKKSVAES